jgi:ribokinase
MTIITVVGSINIDLVTVTPRIPFSGETLTARSFGTGHGGKGANQAVACFRLSRPKPCPMRSSVFSDPQDVMVKMIGAVGSDDFGRNLRNSMACDGIDTSGVKSLEGQNTGVAVILVEEGSGENRILLSPGANYSLQPNDFLSAQSLGIPKPDLVIVQLEIPLETVLAIIELAKATKIVVLFNPAPAVELPAKTFNGLDHLVINESEAAILSGRGMEEKDVDWGILTDEFIRKGVKNVVVTLGRKGAFFSNKLGHGMMVEAVKGVKVVDTTAAGDTFVGAYAVEATKGMSGRWNIEEAVRRSCKAAARTIEKRGAQDAIPWEDEVESSGL